MKALFLDRDGIINRRIIGGYVRTIDEFELLDDILPILQRAHDRGYLLILITNQQGVGKGLMSREDLDTIHDHMQSLLKQRLGFSLDAIYVCTSLASDNDPRRKPQPGMLLEAIADHQLDPAQCWFLGDSLTDAQAGRAAGVKTILVGEFAEGDAEVVCDTSASAADRL